MNIAEFSVTLKKIRMLSTVKKTMKEGKSLGNFKFILFDKKTKNPSIFLNNFLDTLQV